MRALLAIAFLSRAAMADPNAGSGMGAGTTPGAGSGAATGSAAAAEQWQPYTPADHGGFSGIVIVPEPTRDALPYPRGMVIAPPDIGDRMANVLTRPWSWSSRSWWQRFTGGLGAIWDALQPQHL